MGDLAQSLSQQNPHKKGEYQIKRYAIKKNRRIF
jgi:hypothetical protein